MSWDQVYVLNEANECRISQAAREIRELNEQAGTVSKKWKDGTQIGLDRQHAGAVVAFCGLAEVDPILVRETWTNAQGKIHCYLPDGRSVSVKQTGYNRFAKLLVEEWEPRAADLYVLMVGQSPVFRFRGWAPNAEVFCADLLTQKYRSKYQPQYSKRYHLRQYFFAEPDREQLGERGHGFLHRDLVVRP